MAKVLEFSIRGLTPGSSVSSTTITAGGSGYTEATVTFTDGGATRQATGTVVLDGDAVDSITITDPGLGYTGDPTVTISGDGTLATATAARTAATVATQAVELHDDGSLRWTYDSRPYRIDARDSNVTALLKILFTGTSGLLSTGRLFGVTGF
jgi:hypothetical protein